MKLREYRHGDCAGLAALFYDTVHSVNARDYTPEQLNAWATGKMDLAAWDASLSANRCLVAEEDGLIVGFGDISPDGYLDRLFVHSGFQGRGIATAICDELEGGVSASRLTVEASITARPFFEKRGYRVVREQQVERRGVYMTNYFMEKLR